MSILDKVIGAVTPPMNDERRAEAHAKARAAAEPGDWLSSVLDHHEGIEAAFDAVKAAVGAEPRRDAVKRLGRLLTGHSIAEEAVLYPALARAGKTMNAELAYVQQVAAKMQMAALEQLDPESHDFRDKLAHLEGAVLTHVFEEENGWFVDMKAKALAADQARATARYKEEYDRYMHVDSEGAASQRPAEGRSFDLRGFD